MVVGPIALAYNVAGVSALRLQPDTIARIFDGRINFGDAAREKAVRDAITSVLIEVGG